MHRNFAHLVAMIRLVVEVVGRHRTTGAYALVSWADQAVRLIRSPATGARIASPLASCSCLFPFPPHLLASLVFTNSWKPWRNIRPKQMDYVFDTPKLWDRTPKSRRNKACKCYCARLNWPSIHRLPGLISTNLLVSDHSVVKDGY